MPIGLQNTIKWKKKSRNKMQEWKKTCVESGLPPWKLKTTFKTRFASKVFVFKKCLEFKKTSLYVMLNKKWWCCINKFLRPKFGLLQRQWLPTCILLWLHVWRINQEDIDSYQMPWLLLWTFHLAWKLR